MKIEENPTFSILVMSRDQNSDLWTPFSTCFKRYWSDCPAPVYLVTEINSSTSETFTRTINCGPMTAWTDRLDFALTQIDTEYVIILCDDYLLCDVVDNTKIDLLLRTLEKTGAGNLRMLPNPAPKKEKLLESGIGVYPKSLNYRISLQAGIWDKKYLEQFKGMHTTPWGFERLGSKLSENFDPPILYTTKNFFPFLDAVHKGKWEQNGVALCERNEIEIDLKFRGQMTNLNYVKKHAKGAVVDILPRFTSYIMNLLSRIQRRF